MNISLTDVPAPVQPITAENCLALRQVLTELFATYPPDNTIAQPAAITEQKPAEFCRYKALQYTERESPEIAAYWACDTGVPNQEILSVYALLFL